MPKTITFMSGPLVFLIAALNEQPGHWKLRFTWIAVVIKSVACLWIIKDRPSSMRSGDFQNSIEYFVYTTKVTADWLRFERRSWKNSSLTTQAISNFAHSTAARCIPTMPVERIYTLSLSEKEKIFNTKAMLPAKDLPQL